MEENNEKLGQSPTTSLPNASLIDQANFKGSKQQDLLMEYGLKRLYQYGVFGFVLAVLIPNDAIANVAAINIFVAAIGNYVPAIDSLAEVSQVPNSLRLWLAIMWILYPPISIYFAWVIPTPLTSPSWQTEVTAIVFTPLIFVIIGLIIWIPDLILTNAESLNYKTGKGTALMATLVNYRIGYGILGSICFYVLAYFSGAWFRVIFDRLKWAFQGRYRRERS